MKVLMVGHYSLGDYSRGKILYKGLRKNNVKVDIFLGKGKLKYFKIARRIIKNDYDIIIATGTITLFVSKLLSRKPVIFDAFISNYDTLVCDRKIVPKNSLKAKLLWLGDKYSCKFADKVIVDTEEHKNYFISEFSLDEGKFNVIPIGADDEIFYPKEVEKSKKFNVTFIGSFIPLQGIEYIIKAAKILENEKIEFNFVGYGQTFEKMQDFSQELRVRNINLLGWQSPERVPLFIAEADVCLGIFGITDKAKRVIPNKVFETIAMRKPLITGDTPAVRRFFRDRKNCILCKIGDPKAIADAILELKNNPKLREKIAENGYTLFRKNFSIEKIGEKIRYISST